MKVYRDAVGDADAGHGDITGVRISDTSGLVTFGLDLRNLRDTVVVTFDTNCDNHDDYVLSFRSHGSGELNRIDRNDSMFEMRAPAIARRHSRSPAGTTTYTFRFGSRSFGKATAFGFEAHVDTEHWGDVSDTAPDSGGYWRYDLLSR